ncbi:MAG: hypothetical protein KDC34_18995 [Saprospiraceae bacterium]|nr:hypothetical protein [Saprospiraceae bacterium]
MKYFLFFVCLFIFSGLQAQGFPDENLPHKYENTRPTQTVLVSYTHKQAFWQQTQGSVILIVPHLMDRNELIQLLVDDLIYSGIIKDYKRAEKESVTILSVVPVPADLIYSTETYGWNKRG